MRWNQRRLVLTAEIAFWLLAGATLSAVLADRWWGFELFVHFKAQYLFGGAAVAVVLWLLGQRLLALVAVGLCAVNAIATVPLLFAPSVGNVGAGAAQAATAQSPATLRVLSLNVFGGNRDYQRTFDYIRAKNPDVLVLLEVTPAWGAALRELQPHYAYSWVMPTGMRSGMAMFSHEQPLAAREVDLGNTGERSLVLTLATRDGPIAVLGTHLYWPLGPDNARVRNAQLASIARVAREVREPLLVAGDLNVTPFSPYFQAMLRDGQLRSCNGGRLTPTWPARVPFLFIQIDHCLAGSGVAVERFATGPYLGSDHYPIEMEVRVASAAPAR